MPGADQAHGESPSWVGAFCLISAKVRSTAEIYVGLAMFDIFHVARHAQQLLPRGYLRTGLRLFRWGAWQAWASWLRSCSTP
ncbi:hypothetical protein D5S19_20335 [Amycolatopsis panacis]|uniref:Uncharacterized protein n=1 Tax=Amycolatopsis panacis TaxID=2340917 RepID=A0A419I0V0_9PSEU|nr:hypothetical protein D5S19_20335 [Amycolatopsis panacis]